MPAKKKTTSRTQPKKKSPEGGKKRASTSPPREGVHDVESILASLERLGSKRTRDEMGTRYGITGPTASKAFGVPMAAMLNFAKGLRTKDPRRNHELALLLWDARAGIYEARMVAAMVDEPSLVTGAQMDRWAKDFDNWGIVDTVCFKLFDQVEPELAFRKVRQWAASRDEFVKRAAFALLACVALHNKDADDELFAACLPLADRAAADERNFVKKGVSWALRGIAGRSPELKKAVVELARRLAASNAGGGDRWVGKDVLRGLRVAR